VSTAESPDASPTDTLRPVAAVVPATETFEGEGFRVHRPFPHAGLDMLDPFLLLDEMGPMDLAPGEAKGAPDHPHRGFETVTYLLDGEFVHEDSVGNRGTLSPGDLQWMTAGSGVVHSEMPSERIQGDGGRLHGLQLWVNLPAADKMTPPRYQDLDGADVATVAVDGGMVRVIAGSALGVEGTAATHVPILYAHVTLQPGATLELPVADDRTTFAYVLAGRGAFGPDATHGSSHEAVIFDQAGGAVSMSVVGDEPLDAIVLAGQPIREPVARYGPFVMNTKAEILQAMEDFQAGRLGRIER
jgi:redox-sensitive bicupin YhaK (pirin superfamily)